MLLQELPALQHQVYQHIRAQTSPCRRRALIPPVYHSPSCPERIARSLPQVISTAPGPG